MAATDRKNDATDRMDEPPGENSYESSLPSYGWFAEPRRLPRTGNNVGKRHKQKKALIWWQQRPNCLAGRKRHKSIISLPTNQSDLVIFT
jgi:hypothetical protein